ncbi:coth protein-domain-containing protein [Dichotomocladium elegans]|nr:coth protein-domain-containing protein [Dichotomocladium elegans]
MRVSFALGLLLVGLTASTKAATVTFRVVAPGASECQVSVNGGAPVTLSAQDPQVPYFVGQTDAPDQAKYKYIVGGTSEPFDRTLEAGRNSTRNDFFNRTVTYANIPSFPWPINENSQWTRGGPKAPMFDTNYVPSIFMTGNPDEMNTLVKTVPATRYTVKFTFIGPEEVLTYENCTFGIHGAGKKHNNNKQSWLWSLPPGKTIYNRNYIKLRHMEEDPTQMREKLYADILEAMGVYVGQSNIVRFYINGVGFGTFDMLDDITQYSYINAVFYNGNPPAQIGPLFDGASGASFQYSSNQDGYSSWIPNPASPEDYTAIAPLCETLNKTNMLDDGQVATLGNMFDIDRFIRFMVMEYLAGHWDGYWMAQTNDGAYRDGNMWYYLGQDFDATFGVNLGQTKEFVSVSYTQYPTLYPGGVMINGLLQNPTWRLKFENYLKNTTAVLFNNYTLTARVLAYQEFLMPDLEWDRSIVQQSPGINFGWTFDQVKQNLWQGVTAPAGGTTSPGGASWGLLEWVVAKSEAVAKEFNVQIVTHPVLGPSTTAQPAATPAGNPSAAPDHSSPSQGSTSTSSAASARRLASPLDSVMSIMTIFATAIAIARSMN